MESENVKPEVDGIWEQLPSCADDRRTYAWRMYRVHDAQRNCQHILAVGTAQSGNLGQERLDLVAYRLEASRFSMAGKKELVCQMSARRSFGVKLTNGFVIIEQDSLRSLNIGSLCFNEIVRWAFHIAPNDAVEPITLLASHADSYDIENLERRYRFYLRFGIRFAVEGRALHCKRSPNRWRPVNCVVTICRNFRTSRNWILRPQFCSSSQGRRSSPCNRRSSTTTCAASMMPLSGCSVNGNGEQSPSCDLHVLFEYRSCVSHL